MIRSTLSRYLVREIAAHLAGIFAVVLAVFLSRRLGMILDDALEGSVSADVVFQVLGLRTLMALPSLLPAVLYLAILLGLGRLRDNHELTALAACGVSPRRIALIVLAASGVAALLIGILSLEVRPRAAERLRFVEDHATAATRIGGLRSGRFYEVGREGREVVFAEARGPDGHSLSKVFVQIRRDDQIVIYRSERAFDDVDEIMGYRFLRLVDGYEYVLESYGQRYEVTRFAEMILRTELPVELDPARGEKLRPWSELLRSSSADDIAELQWRLTMPASAFILALLAVSLSQTGRARGRYARLLPAMAIYLVYRQMLATAKDWVAGGSIPPLPGLWGIHALALAGALLLFGFEWLAGLARRARETIARTLRTPGRRPDIPAPT